MSCLPSTTNQIPGLLFNEKTRIIENFWITKRESEQLKCLSPWCMYQAGVQTEPEFSFGGGGGGGGMNQRNLEFKYKNMLKLKDHIYYEIKETKTSIHVHKVLIKKIHKILFLFTI